MLSQIEKGIYFRVDSVDKGDSLETANEGCVKVSVIQYISPFKKIKNKKYNSWFVNTWL